MQYKESDGFGSSGNKYPKPSLTKDCQSEHSHRCQLWNKQGSPQQCHFAERNYKAVLQICATKESALKISQERVQSIAHPIADA